MSWGIFNASLRMVLGYDASCRQRGKPRILEDGPLPSLDIDLDQIYVSEVVEHVDHRHVGCTTGSMGDVGEGELTARQAHCSRLRTSSGPDEVPSQTVGRDGGSMNPRVRWVWLECDHPSDRKATERKSAE